MTDAANMLAQLPHAEPFRFVSEVTDLSSGQSAAGVWQVEGTEPFFVGHFPGRPIVPGVLLAEALAQISGLAAFVKGDEPGSGDPAVLAHVNLRFEQTVRPPATIHLRSVLSRRLGNLRLFDVAAEVGGRPAARGTLALAGGDAQSGSP